MAVGGGSGDALFDAAAAVALVLPPLTLLLALVSGFSTPYGRFATNSALTSAVRLSPRLGWFLLELPSWSVFLAVWPLGRLRREPFALWCLAVWVLHYANRGVVMPWLLRAPPGTRSFSLLVVAVGWIVTPLHAYLNARWVSELAGRSGWAFVHSSSFLLGALLYFSGLALNVQSDAILRGLRARQTAVATYRVPVGGLFRYVSSPQYLTELWLWSGWLLMTWGPGALFILLISAANLVPRAAATHRWYHEHFGAAYPRERRTLVPFVW